MAQLNDFLNSQKELDDIIMERFYKNGGEITTKELLNSKVLALFAEVSEFANELGSFKYWKRNHHKDTEKILEEFMDILFFWLSIANLLEFSNSDLEKAYKKKLEKNMKRQREGY